MKDNKNVLKNTDHPECIQYFNFRFPNKIMNDKMMSVNYQYIIKRMARLIVIYKILYILFFIGTSSTFIENTSEKYTDIEIIGIASGLGDGLSNGVDVNYCISCHTRYAGQRPQPHEENCKKCHPSHGMPIPPFGGYSPHPIHAGLDQGEQRGKRCAARCHRSIECSDCHDSHVEPFVPNIINNTNDTVQIPKCTSCHGNLPNPGGHQDIRNNLGSGKHSWMGDCRVCHASDKRNLSFSGLSTIDIGNRSDINNFCKTCHSAQWEKMSVGEHGKIDGKCVECHNPHTTRFTDIESTSFFRREIANASSFNLSNLNLTVENVKQSIERIPIFGNLYVLIIFILIVMAAVFEHILTRHETGQVIMADNIRIVNEEAFSKTLEIDIVDMKCISDIFTILKPKNVNVLGTTIKNIPDSTNHRLVLFLDLSNIDIEKLERIKEDILDDIKGIDKIVSAEYTDKYEI